MHLFCRNVNDAFDAIVRGMSSGQIRTRHRVSGRSTAQGDTLTIDEPVMITYEKPMERVLLNSARDANPFFHVYESLWILAGRNDVAPLQYYASKVGEIASDDGKTFNGAYGYRWRCSPTLRSKLMQTPCLLGEELAKGVYPEVDQLDILVSHLKANPDSRRAVLQMWNVEDDLLKIGTPCATCKGDRQMWPTCGYCNSTGMENTSKDVCCNLSVMFELRASARAANLSSLNLSKEETAKRWGKTAYELDICVTNRSNDIVWGMLGSNYVHFGFLQEYMAARLGVEVGRYTHMSNNAHVYLNNWKPDEWLAVSSPCTRDYDYQMLPLGRENPEAFVLDGEIKDFVERHSKDAMAAPYSERFLEEVAQPMSVAFHWYKRKEYDTALEVCQTINADDWREVATAWINRRKK